MKLVTSEIMRGLDKKALEFGIESIILMENAGRSVYQAIIKDFKNNADKGVVVFSGKGNNGGDGFVTARYLINNGFETDVVFLGDPGELSDDAKANHTALSRITEHIHYINSTDELKSLGINIKERGLVVDALLGTGIKGDVKVLYMEIINMINESGLPVVSVDIPSGVDADSGQVLGTAVRAKKTVTFGLAKIGLVVHPGCEHAGDLEVADISIPKRLIDSISVPYNLVTHKLVGSMFKPRGLSTNKGDYGHVLVIGGSQGKSGSVILAAKAALRAGSGLVTVSGPEGLMPIFESTVTEALKEPLNETLEGFIARSAIEQVDKLMQTSDVVALGPGMGTEKETIDFVHNLLDRCKIPMVIDADGINIIAHNPDVLLSRGREDLVLTPHPGEFGRLVNMHAHEINKDRIRLSSDFAKRYRCTLVLKGAKTVIAAKNGDVWVNPTGNPGMATGGMGDVLTGLISGLIAIGLTTENAAIAGVFIHGMAGDMIYAYRKNSAILAGDLLDRIPYVISNLNECPSL